MAIEFTTVSIDLIDRHPKEFNAQRVAQDLYSGLTAEEFIALYKHMGELLCGFVSCVGGSTNG